MSKLREKKKIDIDLLNIKSPLDMLLGEKDD